LEHIECKLTEETWLKMSGRIVASIEALNGGADDFNGVAVAILGPIERKVSAGTLPPRSAG